MTPDQLNALLSAAWLAGREEAAERCMSVRQPDWTTYGAHVQHIMGSCRAAILATPPPTPEQLEKLR